jgi:phosphatidylserine decarboxylase
VRIDRAAWPFVGIACLPAAVALFWSAAAAIALLVLPVAIAAFFRDPERTSSSDPALVLAPADGTVMHAGPADPRYAPTGQWLQIVTFLSPLDVHINRAPVSGVVRQIAYHPGSFVPAYRHDAAKNERSEIWLDHGGVDIVVRQIVGRMARRVVCRLTTGQTLAAGERIGLMKFGSRMDVYLPLSATILVKVGDKTVAGESVLARLAG